MVEARTPKSESMAGRVVLVLVVAAVLFTTLSITILTLISHNFYAASYYTFAALFDANPMSADALLLEYAQPFTTNFYLTVGVSVIDGIAKAVIIGFVLAAFIDFLTGIDLKSRFNIMTARGLKKHTIVCGYSALGETLCKQFRAKEQPFVVVEKNPQKAELLVDKGYVVINGDFTKTSVLHTAGLQNARAVVFSAGSDYVNMLGIVTARHMRNNIRIVARAKDEDTITKMQRGGAEFCLVPEIVTGIEIGEKISEQVL